MPEPKDKVRLLRASDSSIPNAEKRILTVNIFNRQRGGIDRWAIDFRDKESVLDALRRVSAFEFTYHEKLRTYSITGYMGQKMEGRATPAYDVAFDAIADRNGYIRHTSQDKALEGMGLEMLVFDTKEGKFGIVEVVDDNGYRLQLAPSNIAASGNMELFFSITSKPPSMVNEADKTMPEWKQTLFFNGKEIDVASGMFYYCHYKFNQGLNELFLQQFAQVMPLSYMKVASKFLKAPAQYVPQALHRVGSDLRPNFKFARGAAPWELEHIHRLRGGISRARDFAKFYPSFRASFSPMAFDAANFPEKAQGIQPPEIANAQPEISRRLFSQGPGAHSIGPGARPIFIPSIRAPSANSAALHGAPFSAAGINVLSEGIPPSLSDGTAAYPAAPLAAIQAMPDNAVVHGFAPGANGRNQLAAAMGKFGQNGQAEASAIFSSASGFAPHSNERRASLQVPNSAHPALSQVPARQTAPIPQNQKASLPPLPQSSSLLPAGTMKSALPQKTHSTRNASRAHRTNPAARIQNVGAQHRSVISQPSAPIKAHKGRVTTLVLDLDGLLAASERLHYETFNEVLAPFGIKVDEKFYLANYIGTGSRHIVESELARHGIKADPLPIMERRAALFSARVREGRLSPMPGAAKLVALAKKRRIKMVVASGGHRENVDAELKALGLSLIKSVAYEDVAKIKPHPEMFLKAAKLIGSAPSSCIVIGDSAADMVGARRALMPSLLVSARQSAKVRATATRSAKTLEDKKTLAWLESLFAVALPKKRAKPWVYSPPKNSGAGKKSG